MDFLRFAYVPFSSTLGNDLTLADDSAVGESLGSDDCSHQVRGQHHVQVVPIASHRNKLSSL